MTCTQALYSALKSICLPWSLVHHEPLHTDWVFKYGRNMHTTFCELVLDSCDGQFPSSHYPLYVEFTLPRHIQTAELLDHQQCVRAGLQTSSHMDYTLQYIIHVSSLFKISTIRVINNSMEDCLHDVLLYCSVACSLCTVVRTLNGIVKGKAGDVNIHVQLQYVPFLTQQHCCTFAACTTLHQQFSC